jgi:hypothetical protein
MVETELRRRLEANFQAFSQELPHHLKEHEHEFALIKDARLILFRPTAREAFEIGMAEFGRGWFSVQKVDRSPANLGIHSYAVHWQRSI